VAYSYGLYWGLSPSAYGGNDFQSNEEAGKYLQQGLPKNFVGRFNYTEYGPIMHSFLMVLVVCSWMAKMMSMRLRLLNSVIAYHFIRVCILFNNVYNKDHPQESFHHSNTIWNLNMVVAHMVNKILFEYHHALIFFEWNVY
jgi:hypothetical protein